MIERSLVSARPSFKLPFLRPRRLSVVDPPVFALRKPQPSADYHTVACCTSAASPSCWCHGNGAHTDRISGRVFDRHSRIMWPLRKPRGQAGLPVAARQNTLASPALFHFPAAGCALDSPPSIDSVRARWSDERCQPSPTQGFPSLSSPATRGPYVQPVEHAPIPPNGVEDPLPPENQANLPRETTVRAP